MISVLQATWKRWPVQLWVSNALAVLLFTLPISSSGKSIFLAWSFILIVFPTVHRQDLRNTLSQTWCQAALFLFFVALISCLWSPATLYDKIFVLEKYSKLLYLPILAVGFSYERSRRVAINAFLIAMLVTCIISILKYIGVVTYHEVTEPGRVFRNYIMTGYMMSFATYLSALLAIRSPGRERIIYILLTILFSYQILFVNTGRTGYVIYTLLMGLLMIQVLSWRQAILALLLGSSLLAGTYYVNPSMQKAIGQAFIDWNSYHHDNKDTTVGYRLQFHQYAYDLFQRHPWIGNGIGSFSYTYRQEDPIPSRKNLLEPHSQYWLIAAELGLLGLLAFGTFMGSLIIAACRLQKMKIVAFAVILPFLVGCLSDSLLFYSGTGYFFILFMALCLGERINRSNV